jgi:hypothetical protein
MSMTLSFLAKFGRNHLAALVLCTCVALPVGARAQTEVAPDSPRPASARPPFSGRGVEAAQPPARPTVELKSVTVRRVDEKMAKLAGPQFMHAAEEPFYVEVQTQASLGNTARSSLPVILLNGERLLNTRATGDRTLVAFLPNLKSLKDSNTVAVVWLGDSTTKTRQPLTFALRDIVR